MSATLSACMVVCNEEGVIGRCLQSLQGVVDEIIVVHDGPCQDGTLDICRAYKARVFVRDSIGIAEPHRVFSFEQASGDWILLIDADEYLTEELRSAIRTLIQHPDVDLYCFVWPYTDGKRDLTAHLNHPYRSCLARRSKIRYFGIPQEPLWTSGSVRKLPFCITHRPAYDNYRWQQFRRKWMPRNRLTAEYVWRPAAEIPTFGVADPREVEARLLRYRRSGLLRSVSSFAYMVAWQLYKGMWKLGADGLRITLLTALNAAAIQYLIHKRGKQLLCPLNS